MYVLSIINLLIYANFYLCIFVLCLRILSERTQMIGAYANGRASSETFGNCQAVSYSDQSQGVFSRPGTLPID
jgi:hypothetical protein